MTPDPIISAMEEAERALERAIPILRVSAAVNAPDLSPPVDAAEVALAHPDTKEPKV